MGPPIPENCNLHRGSPSHPQILSLNTQCLRNPTSCNENSLLFVHVNIQSLKHKADELGLILNGNNRVILCVNEHWLREEEINLYVPPCFNLITSYCRPNQGYGGSSIYVSHNLGLRCTVFDVKDLCVKSTFEAAVMLVPALKLIVISVYHSPDSDAKEFVKSLGNLLLHMEKYSKHKTLIFGDLNFDVRKNTPKNANLLNMLRSHNLFCANYRPTRKLSCLDNFITNVHNDDFELGLLNVDYLTDHKGIWVKLTINKPMGDCEPIQYVRLLTDKNINSFREKLKVVNWNNVVYASSNVEEACSRFISTLSGIFNTSCPVVVKRSKIKVSKQGQKTLHKWFSPQLWKLRSVVLNCHDKVKNGTMDKTAYTNLKRHYRSQIRLAKCRANDN